MMILLFLIIMAAPTASISVSNPTLLKTEEPFIWDASASTGWDRILVDFGDGMTARFQKSSHAYIKAGNYTITVTASTLAGATATATQNVTVTDPSTAGTVTTVNTFAALQAAINSANGGDVINVDPSGNYLENTLNFPNRGAGVTDYITIRPTTWASLPDPRNRINPTTDNANLIKLKLTVQVGGTRTIHFDTASHHWRLIGFRIDVVSTAAPSVMIEVGDTSLTLTSQLPNHIIFRHCAVVGAAAADFKRAFYLNGDTISIISSYISGVKSVGNDSQTINGLSGTGNYSVYNCYLEAAGENVMLGGGDSPNSTMQIANVEFQRCHFKKDTAWRGSSWTIKNIFELKVGQNIVVSACILENNWVAAQSGMAINIKSVNQDGTAPWSKTQGVAFGDSIVRNVAIGATFQGQVTGPVGAELNDVVFDNVLFYNMSGDTWGTPGQGSIFLFAYGTQTGGVSPLMTNFRFYHTTGIHDDAGRQMSFGDDGGLSRDVTAMVFENNIFGSVTPYFRGDGTAEGNATIAAYCSDLVLAKTVLVAANGAVYPAANLGNYPATIADVGFTDANADNFLLLVSSAYHNAASDGTDYGPNIPLLNTATLHTVDGRWVTDSGNVRISGNVTISGRVVLQ